MSKFCLSSASGSMIYGRVMVDPVQNLGDSFSCSIEKVFLCTGADGYVPKYNPTNKEYGCLADAPSLLYRFKILVRTSEFTSSLLLRFIEAKLRLRTHPYVSLCRTRPNQRPRSQHLVMLVLRPHWPKIQLELCLWSDSLDQMASRSLHLRSSRY